ncbi:Arc family DNA-binding protein, partial [Salmonella enterica subsp. enterica serovar Cerro]|nr:Arc family DNA-binding protein [Salmonella enterica subsp. enterica serovar Cerro]
MGRDDPQFNLRLPYELKEKLKQRAKSNGRSLNAELVQIVTEAISKPSPVSGYR